MAIAKTALLLFCKEPVPGKVKTRLAKDIGETEAVKAYLQLLRHTFEVIHKSSFQLILWVEGSTGFLAKEFPDFGHLFTLVKKQSDGDLGEKLTLAFQDAFTTGFKRVLCIGSDCPEITPLHLEQAEFALSRVDVCLGPAEDGGYYLIGLNKPEPSLFQGIPWSTETVLLDSLQIAKEQSLSFELLEKLRDVDTLTDYSQFQEFFTT